MRLGELRTNAAGCTQCPLHEGRINPVFDKGDPYADIMVCGMVPAHDENLAGLPFVGRAGKLLDIILKAAGLTYNKVYITNLVKCFVAAGNSLEKIWIDACRPYLEEQIRLIDPSVIITLGADAGKSLCFEGTTVPNVPMKHLRGNIVYYNDNTVIVPTYHPSFLLRGGGEKSPHFEEVLEDFEIAKACLYESIKYGIYN